MLYELYRLISEQFPDMFGPLRLFSYITFRAFCAIFMAFFLSLSLGPYLIRTLRRYKIGEDTTKSDAPQIRELHAIKKDTPTMGGMMMVFTVLVTTLICARWDNGYIWGAFAVMLAFALVGIRDDWVKLKKSNRGGLSERVKMALMLAVSLGSAIGVCLVALEAEVGRNLDVWMIPFIPQDWYPQLSTIGAWFGFPVEGALILFLSLSSMTILATANATNITDGLDGLAVGLMIMVAVALAVLCYLVGRADVSELLGLPHVRQSGELTVFLAAMIGAGLGFLWFNAHPADIFMGDSGSLPFGASLGYVAVVIRHEMVLLLCGALFVVEVLSVIMQVTWFRRTGRRFFRVAPLHHHFEVGGMAESKVVVRFWIVGVMLVILTLTTLKVR